MEEKDFSGRPEKPEASDCCNSGCDPCVLDLYEKRIKEWENGFTDGLTSIHSQMRTDLLSETKLKPFCLVNKLRLSENVYLFKFQPFLNNNDPSQRGNLQVMEKVISGILPYKIGQHVVLKGYDIHGLKHNLFENINKNKISDEQNKTVNYITRSYTPITISSQLSNCCFEIVVKIYINGEMSAFLNTLEHGNIVECRGPYGNFSYTANNYRHILMLCIGTGIAPMYGIIKFILNNEKDETFIHLMYGVQTENDIILRDELRQCTEYWNFKEEIYLSKQSDMIQSKFGECFIFKRIDGRSVMNYISNKNKTELLVLICGTDLFCQSMNKCVLEFGVDKSNIHVF